jgi:hypothetical protein
MEKKGGGNMEEKREGEICQKDERSELSGK